MDRGYKDKDKDKDLFIDPREFVVEYSKAPEQQPSSVRPICHSHVMTNTGREPATILQHRSSLRYALRQGRRVTEIAAVVGRLNFNK